MADKKVILEVEIIEGNAQSTLNELNASLKSLDKTHKDYKPTLQLIAQAERDLAKAQQNRILVEKGLVSSSTKVDKSTKKTAKQMKQLSSDTGASTSATLELGRVFSDAPYGIRGVANNIQQLASNLFFISKKTDEATGKTVGFKGAVGSLLKNLIGPAGVLVAFQAGIALLDYFSGGAKEAAASTSDFESSVKSLTKTLEELYVPESDVVTKIEEYIKLNTKRIGIDKKLKDNFEDLSDVENRLVEVKNNLSKAIESEAKGENDLQGEYSTGVAVRQGIVTLTEEQSKLEKQQIDLTKTSVDLINEKNKVTLEYESAAEGTVKALEKTKSELLKEQKTLSDSPAKWAEYAEKIKKVQAEINAITGKGDPRDKVDVLGLDSIDIGENKKKMKKVLDAVADAVGVDLKKDPLKIDTNLDLELSDEAKKIIADKLKSDLDNLMLDSKLEDAKEFIDKSKAVLGAMTDFVDSEFERELTIEQNKTNALNTELNNRLNNENLSKDQRASIQNQIAQNDEKLRVKQDAIEKKKFKMNKAVRIANALMDTASAAIGVMADSKGGFIARLANAIPTIAFGLAQVAAISRQKFKSSASKTPISTTGGGGSSGGGAARAEPSFNIVGRSNNNQLLDAIQSQFDKPLKAYVVSGDVTNQQELDRNISSGASI